jgi:putative inorganic carbon (HCO3(-)) transporter
MREETLSSWKLPLLFVLLALIIGSAIGVFVVELNKPIIILVGLVALIAFIVTISSVEFGLLFLVFITYTRFSDVVVQVHNAPSVAKSFIAVLILAIFIRWALFNETPTGWQMPALLVGIYGLIGFASLLYAQDSELVIHTLDNYVKDALITLVVVVILKRASLFRNVIWSLIAAGIFIGTLSVFQYITKSFDNNYWGFAVAKYMQITTGSPNDYRIVGPVGDPNFFAQIMIVLVPLALERLLHERKLLLKILAGWALIASFLTVVFTFSRGGFLALIVSLIIFFIIYPPRPYELLVSIGVGVILLFFIPTTYFDRILSLQNLIPGESGQINLRADRAIQGRASENLTAWLMIQEHPFLGVGLSNFPSLYQDYTKQIGLAPSASARSPHNLYLEVAAETGVLGLSAFMLMVWLAIRSVLIARKQFLENKEIEYANLVTGFAVGFAGYLLAAVFVHAAFPRYFYLLIGIAYSLPLIAGHKRDNSYENNKSSV